MKIKAGDRVGAILCSNPDKSIDFLGYGVYEGDFYPTEAVGWMAEAGREIPEYTNLRIRLDNGKVVYGCECWWGDEVRIMKYLEGAKVNLVDIEQVRKNYREGK